MNIPMRATLCIIAVAVAAAGYLSDSELICGGVISREELGGADKIDGIVADCGVTMHQIFVFMKKCDVIVYDLRPGEVIRHDITDFNWCRRGIMSIYGMPTMPGPA